MFGRAVDCSVSLFHHTRETVADVADRHSRDADTERHVVNILYPTLVNVLKDNRTGRSEHAQVHDKTHHQLRQIDTLSALKDALKAQKKEANEKSHRY